MSDPITRATGTGMNDKPLRVRWERLQGRNEFRWAAAASSPAETPTTPRRATNFVSATRDQRSLLTPLERQTLAWIAKRLPASVQPDHLTALGFAAMLLAGLCYWLARWNPLALFGSVLFLAVNWFGDSLDGTLARARNQQRPRFGFYVDHVIDAVGTLALLGGVGLSGYMHFSVACGVLIAYFLLSIEVYLATYTRGVFRMAFVYCGPTELRILLAMGSLILLFHPTATINGEALLLCDVAGGVAIAGMLAVAGMSMVRNTRALYEEERL